MATRYDLDGNVAIVTGGAQGIGRAIAERFLDSGAKVAIWDPDVVLSEKTVDELSGVGEIKAYGIDVTNSNGLGGAVDQVTADFGSIEILVNNAGIAGANATVWEYDTDEWLKTINVNLNGPFYCCRAVVPGMIERGYGRIVNIASIAGKEGNPMASPYSASKAGLIALTKSLGKELAGYDIGVNCLTPAAAKTAIFDQITEEHINYMLSKIPRARFVQVEEIATMVTFMASKECSFTTGGVFDISGGRATY